MAEKIAIVLNCDFCPKKDLKNAVAVVCDLGCVHFACYECLKKQGLSHLVKELKEI